MITEIKMEVTPDLSKRVKEIVSNNGGRWFIGTKKTKCLNHKYLFIDEYSVLTITNNNEDFKNNKFKEISPCDFIASQGQQEWLPNYGKEALFSDNEKEINTFVFCKPLPKEISFIQFLKDNAIYDTYMHNIEIENQRWYDIEKYKLLSRLQKHKSKEWILCAFNWEKQKEGFDAWNNLNEKWINITEQNSDTNIVWGE